MQQGPLPFHYEEENQSTGMTAWSGLPAYLDLASVARFGESVRRHVGVREGTQGWTDATLIETHKRQASYCYEKYKAYQPLTSC